MAEFKRLIIAFISSLHLVACSGNTPSSTLTTDSFSIKYPGNWEIISMPLAHYNDQAYNVVSFIAHPNASKFIHGACIPAFEPPEMTIDLYTLADTINATTSRNLRN